MVYMEEKEQKLVQVNAMGDPCPIPVVKTKQAIRGLTEPGRVAVLVDNEIAVQNLTKMAVQKGYPVTSGQVREREYRVIMRISSEHLERQMPGERMPAAMPAPDECKCSPDGAGTVVVISSEQMGGGSEELGKILMKSFLFALSKQEVLPETVLFYNGGAKMTCEGSPVLEDLQELAEQGVEILTCGTCLDFYGLKDKLRVGGVTNMYAIAEKMTRAGRLVRP